jgi:hypothetical protein
LLVRDQEGRNIRLDRLAYTVERSHAPAYRPVQRDAEIGAVLEQFSVLVSDRGIAGPRPGCQANFDGDSQTLARPVERLVNASLATMDYRKISPVSLKQSTYNGRRELVATPGSVARVYDAHVQIVSRP